MIARFFIDRPVLANVIAWITVLVGAVAGLRLPVAQYPPLTPVTIQVTTNYPGASAVTVQQSVARTIEQQVNGVERMLYMQSTASNDGRYSLTVTFDIGTDPDQAQVAVQNRVAAALPQLPDAVQQQGVVTRKKSTAILQIVTVTSTDASRDGLYLSNFAWLQLRDRLLRLPGVADVNVFGVGQYSMRVWLDPEQMRQRGLTPANVISVLKKQSALLSAGQVGAPPAPEGQVQQAAISLVTTEASPEGFGKLVVKTDSAGAITRLRDVARIELGSQNYSQAFSYDNTPAGGLAIYQLPDANALDTARAVRNELHRLAPGFPSDLKVKIPLDTTVFVQKSIDEVIHTLFEAGALVLLVIVLFLQDVRATLVPATTVPVTIVGALVAMAALGFSINLLTLFALVLCIGIVVDDAIVVVEGVATGIEAGMSPREAAAHAMRELLAPIIGITLVLMSVFLPAAFIPGITGQMYRQFALVIAATALISAVNAATLKPAQSAKYIRGRTHRAPKNVIFRSVDALYGSVEAAYARLVRRLVTRTAWVAAGAALTIIAAGVALMRLPTGFIPTEDSGYLFVAVQLPEAASLERTRAALTQVTQTGLGIPGVAHAISVAGISPLDNNASLANAGLVYFVFDDWSARGKDRDLLTIYTALRERLVAIPEAHSLVLVPPPIPGLGLSGGFQMQLVSTGLSNDFSVLDRAASAFTAAAQRRPEILQVFTPFRANAPQWRVEIDRTRAESLAVSVGDADDTLQTYFGSSFAAQFSLYGQNYSVYVQADSAARATAEQIGRIHVKSRAGDMVPFSAFAAITPSTGPALVSQYNLLPTVSINGAAAYGYSSGQALDAMDAVAAATLPPGVRYEWTGMSFQERRVGSSVAWVFGLALLLVYLVLAGQYESWTTPLPVILSVPLALVGTVITLALTGLPNNLYVQIGLVLLIALSAKNAILIVEVAQSMVRAGASVVDAACEGSRRRFRPILMTSFAFILGVLPLVISSGAGAAARKSIGITVFSGMLASTILAVAVVPVLYVVIEGSRTRRSQ